MIEDNVLFNSRLWKDINSRDFEGTSFNIGVVARDLKAIRSLKPFEDLGGGFVWSRYPKTDWGAVYFLRKKRV